MKEPKTEAERKEEPPAKKALPPEPPAERKQKFDTIQDIPGVGPATAAKLSEMGIRTVEALAVATIKELENAGVGDKQAAKIVSIARESVSSSFVRADELIELRKNVKRLTTGSVQLDGLLGGGLETQTITEFYGEYGAGKSILCHQLAVNAQLPEEKGGLGGGTLYIDTEHTFRPEWILRMAQAKKMDPVETAKNIIYAEAYNSDHQVWLLNKADEVIQKNNIKLIIIDSLTAHFRSEYLGREMLAERQQKLNAHLHKLARMAQAFNAVAVVTNQVMAKPDAFFGSVAEAIGGHIVAHTTHTRVFLRKTHGSPIRICKMISSPYLPEGERVFKITESGIEDTTEEDDPKRR